MSTYLPSAITEKLNVPICAIVAMDEERGIGRNGGLPWHLPQDLKHFSKLTKGHSVLMGRKTFDSLPDKFKPLPERLNLVLSRSRAELPYENSRVFPELDQVLEFCSVPANLSGDVLWVIGGAQLYQLTSPYWERVYLTRVQGKHEADAFFPEFEKDFELLEREEGEGCCFEVYQRRS